MHADISVVDRISGAGIGCSFRVMNRMGACSAETIYENALAHEVDKAGRKVRPRQAIAVHYDCDGAGAYVTDLQVGNSISVERHAVRGLDKAQMAQCINEPTAAGVVCACYSISVVLAGRSNE